MSVAIPVTFTAFDGPRDAAFADGPAHDGFAGAFAPFACVFFFCSHVDIVVLIEHRTLHPACTLRWTARSTPPIAYAPPPVASNIITILVEPVAVDDTCEWAAACPRQARGTTATTSQTAKRHCTRNDGALDGAEEAGDAGAGAGVCA